MLSRVAERIYWMARYLERAENTARIVNVNTNLLLDLPKKFTLGWQPLIEITGTKTAFRRRRLVPKEQNIVRFLIADQKNTSSLLNSLQFARENARTIRDIIPREAWEHINALYLDTKGALPGGLGQRRRFDFLASVISGSQQVSGLLSGTMLHDAGYFFLRLGRNLERADMTTRIIDVQSSNILQGQSAEVMPFENIEWMSVLQSLSGYQSYRQKMQGRVQRDAVLDFLLRDREFPRAFVHCMDELDHCLMHLPGSEQILAGVNRVANRVDQINTDTLSKRATHDFLDSLQQQLGELHDLISRTYFTLPKKAWQKTAAISAAQSTE